MFSHIRNYMTYDISSSDINRFRFILDETMELSVGKDFIDIKCCCCSNNIDFENIIILETSNNIYCKSCIEKICTKCSCGRYVNKNDFTYVKDIDKTLCPICMSMYNIRFCDCCSNHVRNYKRVERKGIYCVECFEKNNCFQCSRCEYSYDEERYGRDGICITCANNAVENSRNYTYKPIPKFFTHNTDNYNQLFMGVEVEMGDSDSSYKVMDFINKGVKNSGLFYAKRDASIPAYGCEIVSHPATLEWHKKCGAWETMLNEAKLHNLKADSLDRCGVHVHMSRRYFTNSQICMLDWFVNKHKDFWKKMARRESHYSSYVEKNESMWGIQTTDRHCALNLSNEHTIELRIFKGSIDINNIYSYIELCEAVTYFIKTFSRFNSFINKENLESMFIDYINANNYPYLQNYIKNIF